MADPLRFHCESGHVGLIPGPIARCPKCDAPVHLSRRFAGVLTDEQQAVELAAVCDAVSGLPEVLAEIARAVHNVCAIEGITIADLSPDLIVTPRGVMVIELLPAALPAA